ncbi:hypothetical protein SAMN05444166_3877 [Singulisphaera sp. GP187]|nr:hypothetical protein SAMN05444166_3877 [Singulisphaera sp. GP187]
MLGLSETTEELFETLADLRAVGCDFLTADRSQIY